MKFTSNLLYVSALSMCIGLASCGKDDEPDLTSETSSDEASAEEVYSANSSFANYDSASNSLANIDVAATLVIVWDGSTVNVSGTADGVDVNADGGAVTVNSTTESVVEYVLRGASDNGSIKFYSDQKFVVTLDGLQLTSQTTSAINNQGKKSLFVCLPEGTTSSLADAAVYTDTVAGEDCKACLFSEGQIIMSGKGTLNVSGNRRHAIATDDYLVVNDAVTLNVTKSVKDGIHTNDYVVFNAGNVNITTTGGDGIDCEGAIFVSDGTFNVSTSGLSAKAIKAVGDIYIVGGTFTLNTSGDAEWESGSGSSVDYSNAACLKTSGALNITGGNITATSTGKGGRGFTVGGDFNLSGGTSTVKTSGAAYQLNSSSDYTVASGVKVTGNVVVTGGSLTATVTGQGAKAMKVAGTYTQSDGQLVMTASGSNAGSSSSGMWGSSSGSYSASAKGIKVTGAIKVSGGKLFGSSSKHEAIESKSTLDVTGGEVYGYSASDDGVNAASNFTIDGGFVCGYATGNDGLDANGNLYIKGGVVFAVGSSSPEMAVDANTEGGYKLYVSGGTLMTVGALESGSSLTQACYSASSWSKGVKYAVTVGSDTYVFTTPTTTAGSGIVVSGATTPTLKSGVTVSGGTTHFDGVGAVVANGTVSGGTSVTLSSYTASSGNMGGGGFRW